MESILAIVVLYRMRADESPAFLSVCSAMTAGSAPELELMVCDNTPYEQTAPAGFHGVYLRDTKNPGLAHWYNVALQRAAHDGHTWLMLLDQDTTVTPAYFEEACRTSAALRHDARIVALVPKLAQHGVVCSPAELPLLGIARPVPEDAVGISERRLFPFNSGALLRVSAVGAVGGFPVAFPLDYLDHAMFAKLQAQGGCVYLLRSVLEHDLSSNTETPGAAAARRQTSVLHAEFRFYRLYGTLVQRCLRRVRLLKAVAGRIVRWKEAGQTWRMLKSALRP